jgi:hypothetical protein
MGIRIATASLMVMATASCAAAASPAARRTIVLVHGAFAGSSSWNGVIGDLARRG